MSSVAAPRRASKSKKSAPVVSLALAIDHTVYGVEPIPAGEFGTKAFRLAKKSSAGEVYDVIRTHDGLVQCDCPSYETTFRGTCGTCKHGAALVALGLLDAPSWSAPVEPTTRPEILPDPPAEIVLESHGGTRCSSQREPGEDDDRSFADELHEAVGLPPIDPPAEEEPIGWERPARRPCPIAPRASERPVKLPPLPDGQYDLAGLVSGQAALLRGQGSAPFALMADRLDELAASIRATGAKSVIEYEDRLSVMEADHAAEIEARGFDRGYEAGLSERA